MNVQHLMKSKRKWIKAKDFDGWYFLGYLTDCDFGLDLLLLQVVTTFTLSETTKGARFSASTSARQAFVPESSDCPDITDLASATRI